MFEPHADLGERPNQVSCPHGRVKLPPLNHEARCRMYDPSTRGPTFRR